MPARAAASPTTAASSGLNRTHTDSLRAASARARLRDPGAPHRNRVAARHEPKPHPRGAAPVPRRAPAGPAERTRRLHRPGNGHRPARRTTTPPAPFGHRRQPVRRPPEAAPTPTPHGTAGRSHRATTPTATAHPPTRPTTPTTTALRSSAVRARSAAGMTDQWGREPESVDNTREKRAAVDNRAEPPGSAPPSTAGSPTSRISCSAGGTAGNSSLEQEIRPRPDRPLESWGTTRSTTATTTIGPATSATRFRRTRPTALCA